MPGMYPPHSIWVRLADSIRWPRGKWNGQRIVGTEIKVRFDVTWWRFGLPTRYGVCLSVGPLHIWTTAAYATAEPKENG